MSENQSDRKSRKYLLTFNNPKEHNATHDILNNSMNSFNWIYYCMCDEIGSEGTYHTHLFFQCENAVHFSKVKKVFPSAHIDECKGSAEQNKNYILKQGKYINTDKSETNIPDTFEEYGEMPLDKAQKNNQISEDVLEMLKDDYDFKDIIEKYPSYMTKISHLEKAKQLFLANKFSDTFRNLEVTYISGETGTGKTRSVMEHYGYKNVYKITNYQHPFDNYDGEDVILFDEFRNSLPLSDMLQYLDGYPCKLPARYSDRYACFTKVYIISNISLNKQYEDAKQEDWCAFVRRINRVLIYKFTIADSDNPFVKEGNQVVVPIEELPQKYEKRCKRYWCLTNIKMY